MSGTWARFGGGASSSTGAATGVAGVVVALAAGAASVSSLLKKMIFFGEKNMSDLLEEVTPNRDGVVDSGEELDEGPGSFGPDFHGDFIGVDGRDDVVGIH